MPVCGSIRPMDFDWRGRLILRKLEEGCTLGEAATAAGMTRQGVWWRCGVSPAFAQAVAAARDTGADERRYRAWLNHPCRGRRGPWWKISSVPPRRVTVDAGREAQQNRADVEMGLKTLSDHFQELGADFGEEIERRASDAKLILDTAAKYGVPVDMLWKPSGSALAMQSGFVKSETVSK